jgi:thioredoxin reductase (NADPH)
MASWDIIVIGGGAAGLSAATAVAQNGLSCSVIDRMGGGGELMNLGPLQDLDEDLTGPDLMGRLQEDAMTAGAELDIAEVTALTPSSAGWHVTTDQTEHDARAVILAIGLAPGTLGLANEPDYEARGLSHCATCDGPLYQGEPVIVAGADRWAVLEAHELAANCSTVTLVTQGAPAPAVEGITIIQGHIQALEGANGLDAVLVQSADGLQRIATQAVFIQTARRPATDFVPPTLQRAADGHIVTNGTHETNLPNLFAAGNARAGVPHTLRFAIEDGRQAAHAALAKLAG